MTNRKKKDDKQKKDSGGDTRILPDYLRLVG
jgi:hypothetical protein